MRSMFQPVPPPICRHGSQLSTGACSGNGSGTDINPYRLPGKLLLLQLGRSQADHVLAAAEEPGAGGVIDLGSREPLAGRHSCRLYAA